MEKRFFRKILMAMGDIGLLNAALWFALLIRFESNVPEEYMAFYLSSYIPITTVSILGFMAFDLYGRLWRYASVDEVIAITMATTFATLVSMGYTLMADKGFPRGVYILFWLLLTAFLGGSRFVLRVFKKLSSDMNTRGGRKKVLVVGAGEAGAMVIAELKRHPDLWMMPDAIVDDDLGKRGMTVHGVKVLGNRHDIPDLVRQRGIHEIIIALPSIRRSEFRRILDICSSTGCKLKTLPGVYELLDGKVGVQEIRDVKIEDLLRRDAVEIDLEEISNYLKDKVILVSGAGGSIGSELCRQIAGFSPERLLLLDICENNLYDLEYNLNSKFPDLDYIPLIGSVRDKKRVEAIFGEYRPQVVFHAAAHKHVPLMEGNAAEAIKNNVFGTQNIAEAADKYGAGRFIFISTDKAVNPANVMGASKRIAEIVIQRISRRSDTIFASVRFGNVLGSQGSVIPLFKKQIEAGGPVTVTHPDITRFFMTIPEAVELVVQAGALAQGGEIFVLDMGEPVKIADLARDMIRLSGLRPDEDIEIVYVGLRPGEKLFEELFLSEEGVSATRYEKIFVAKPPSDDIKSFEQELYILRRLLYRSDGELKDIIRTIVPNYGNPLGSKSEELSG